jgi:hypothetical protein
MEGWIKMTDEELKEARKICEEQHGCSCKCPFDNGVDIGVGWLTHCSLGFDDKEKTYEA